MVIGKTECLRFLTVSGWTFHGVGQSEIVVICNGSPLDAPITSIERPDIALEYDLMDKRVGFRIDIPTTCWALAVNGTCEFSVVSNGTTLPGILIHTSPTDLIAEVRQLISSPDATPTEAEHLISHIRRSGCEKELGDDTLIWLQAHARQLQSAAGPRTAFDSGKSEAKHSNVSEPPSCVVGFHVAPPQLPLVLGWIEYRGASDGRPLRAACNGLLLNKNIFQTQPAVDEAVAQAGTRRFGFEITVPGYVWEFAQDGKCLLQIWADGHSIAGAGIVFSREDLIAQIKTLGTNAPEDIDQRIVVLLIEHVKYAGLLGELSDEQYAFLIACSRLLNLTSFLFGNDQPAPFVGPSPAPGASSIEQEVRLERSLSAFNSAVLRRTEDSRAHFLRIMKDKVAPEDRKRFALRLIPYFCRVGMAEFIFPHINGKWLENTTHSQNANVLSASLPMLLLAGRPNAAITACRKLHSIPQNGWVSTECIAASVTCMIDSLRKGRMNAETAQRYGASVLGIIESFAGGYWTRLHDLELIRSMVMLLENADRFDDGFRAQLTKSAIANYGLCPTFWEMIQEREGNTAYSHNPIREAEAKSQRLIALLTCADVREAAISRECLEILSFFSDQGNVDALAYSREVLAHRLPEIRESAKFLEISRALSSLCQQSPIDIVRFAAIAGRDEVSCPLDASTVLSAMMELFRKPGSSRAESPLLLMSIVDELAGIWKSKSDVVRLAALVRRLAPLCAGNWNYLGFDLMMAVYGLSEPEWRHEIAQAIIETAASELESAIQEATIPAPLLAGLARGRVSLADQEDGPMKEFLTQIEQRADIRAERPKPMTAQAAHGAPAGSPFADTLIVIYSCRRNLSTRIAAIRKTWLTAVRAIGVPYVILVGDGCGRLDGDVLELEVSDRYEDLPAKTMALVRWFVDQTDYQYLYKVDDDCMLDVEAFFRAPYYRKHHYYGRRIERKLGGSPRDWHHSKSWTNRGKKALDPTPDPSVFAAGGAGYSLSRHAALMLLGQAETVAGARLVSGSFVEDKLVGDLLALGAVAPSDEEYDVFIRRRTHEGAVPVGIYGNFFMPGRYSPTKLVHLDGHEDMELAWSRVQSTEVWPKKIWPSYAEPALRGQTSQLELLSEPAKLKDIRDADVVVVSIVRNERVILPHFLDHYRRLGVSVFVMIDNLSDDGSREYLLDQSDVVVYSADTQFKHAHCGVAWHQAVMSSHCIGRWVIAADADEFLMYPGFEARPISSFLKEVEDSGANAVETLQLDMYPEGRLDGADFSESRPFDSACYFDRERLIERPTAHTRFGNTTMRTSALRHRLAPESPAHLFSSQKVALFRYFPWVRLWEGMHCLGNARIYNQSCFLAHFKYHSDFARKAAIEIERKQHFNNAIEYEKYRLMLEESKSVFWSPSASVRFTGSDALFVSEASNRPQSAKCHCRFAPCPPFIIWTVQRTGGSNLSDGIFRLAGPDNCFHEPFNGERIFGPIVNRWKQDGDKLELESAIREVCRSGARFKHCVEVMPDIVNETLARVSQEFGYVHLFLYRKDPVSRILSWHFARTTGIWGRQGGEAPAENLPLEKALPVKELVDRERLCVLRLENIWRTLWKAKKPLMEVAFEDIYEAPTLEGARENLTSAFRFLGIQLDTDPRSTLDPIIEQGGQGTRTLYSKFPDIDGLRSEIAKLPKFDPRHMRWLAESVRSIRLATVPSTVVESFVDTVRPASRPGHLVVAGIVLLAPTAGVHRLLFRVEDNGISVTWGISSPAAARRHPANPHAAKSRFQTPDIPFTPGQVGQLILVAPDETAHAIWEISLNSTN